MNNLQHNIDSLSVDDHPIFYCVVFILVGLIGFFLEGFSLYRETVAYSGLETVMTRAPNIGLAVIGIGIGFQVTLKHILIKK